MSVVITLHAVTVSYYGRWRRVKTQGVRFAQHARDASRDRFSAAELLYVKVITTLYTYLSLKGARAAGSKLRILAQLDERIGVRICIDGKCEIYSHKQQQYEFGCSTKSSEEYKTRSLCRPVSPRSLFTDQRPRPQR